MSADTRTALTGSCKCGLVKYKIHAKLDKDGILNAGCFNCSFCQELGITLYDCDASEDFELTPRVKTLPRKFCRECGNHIFMDGFYGLSRSRHGMFAVNIATVDQPGDGLEFNNGKIEYFDGLTDSQMKVTTSKPFSSGLI